MIGGLSLVDLQLKNCDYVDLKQWRDPHNIKIIYRLKVYLYIILNNNKNNKYINIFVVFIVSFMVRSGKIWYVGAS